MSKLDSSLENAAIQNVAVVHTIDHCDEELIEGKKEEVFISILHFKIGTLP